MAKVQAAEPIDLLAEARYQQYAENLKKVALLAPLSDSERLALARRLSTAEFQGGEAIITKDDTVGPGDGMYMIQVRPVHLACVA